MNGFGCKKRLHLSEFQNISVFDKWVFCFEYCKIYCCLKIRIFRVHRFICTAYNKIYHRIYAMCMLFTLVRFCLARKHPNINLAISKVSELCPLLVIQSQPRPSYALYVMKLSSCVHYIFKWYIWPHDLIFDTLAIYFFTSYITVRLNKAV